MTSIDAASFLGAAWSSGRSDPNAEAIQRASQTANANRLLVETLAAMPEPTASAPPPEAPRSPPPAPPGQGRYVDVSA